MNDFWNERYKDKEFVYGKMPNAFLVEQLKKMNVGSILFPCEGEGRNVVYAAKNGWLTEAFDLSEEGFRKAQLLASENNVSISYQLANALSIEYPKGSFDVVAIIFAHFPSLARRIFHQKIINWLKPGGLIILEAFNPLQLNNHSGGPKELTMLYTKEMLEDDFKSLTVKLLYSDKIILNEGKYHQGIADVIRYIGKKEDNYSNLAISN